MFLKLQLHKNCLEVLLKCKFLGATLRASDSVGQGWGPRRCTIKMLLGDVDAMRTTLQVVLTKILGRCMGEGLWWRGGIPNTKGYV